MHSSYKKNEKLGRIIGHVCLHHSPPWELPACKRMFFTSPLGANTSLCRRRLSCSRTAATLSVSISNSEIHFISLRGSLMNLCSQSCSMSDRNDILLPYDWVFFFLRLFRIWAGRKNILFMDLFEILHVIPRLTFCSCLANICWSTVEIIMKGWLCNLSSLSTEKFIYYKLKFEGLNLDYRVPTFQIR